MHSSKMVRKTAIFDVDGTLVDSIDLHARAWQEAFSEFGQQLRFSDLRSQIGKGSDMLIPCFLSQEESERFGEKLSKRQEEIFKERYFLKVRPFAAVPELFARLRKEGWTVVLASSGKRDEVARYKKLIGIEELTDLEISSDEAHRSKPHPDIFEVTLKQLGDVTPKRVLAFGDTPYDIEAAHQLSIRTIALLGGGYPEEQLRSAGAIDIFRGPAELLFRYEDWSCRIE
jgi:HAD superfamily hydrolase (TIGR01509 family)